MKRKSDCFPYFQIRITDLSNDVNLAINYISFLILCWRTTNDTDNPWYWRSLKLGIVRNQMESKYNVIWQTTVTKITFHSHLDDKARRPAIFLWKMIFIALFFSFSEYSNNSHCARMQVFSVRMCSLYRTVIINLLLFLDADQRFSIRTLYKL